MNHTLYYHRTTLKALVSKNGIRATARSLKMSHMAMSRFRDGTGADSAEILYRLADLFGYVIKMQKNKARKRPRADRR